MRRILVVLTLLSVPAIAFAQEAARAPSALEAMFVQYVVPALGTALAAIIGAIGVFAASWLRAKGVNEKQIAFGERMLALARDAVAHVDREIKAGLLAATADGVLTKDEIRRIQHEALKALKAFAGERAPAEAEALLGVARPMFEAWLGSLVQRAFDGKKLAEEVVRPVSPLPDPAAAALVGAGLEPRDAPTAAISPR